MSFPTELLVDPPPAPEAMPSLGGIPVLLDDPGSAFERWSLRFAEFQAVTARNVHRLEETLASGDLLPATRVRLGTLAEALRETRLRVTEILVQAGLAPRAPDGARPAPPGITPGSGAVLEGFSHVMRDWSWGDSAERENPASVDLIASLLGERPPPLGQVLVLGAGGARLAYDLHTRWAAERTIALDVNPLPFLIAQRILRGESMILPELLLNPARPEDAAVQRTLACPGPLPANFHFVFADGRDPPFVPGSFDTVVTPWYIDQVAQEMPDVIDVVHDMLRPGGRWIDLGPLVYPVDRRHEARYTFVEVCGLALRGGFELEATGSRRLAHLFVPEGTQGRSEQVHAFVARREADPRLARARAPLWLKRTDLPIPRFEGLDGWRSELPELTLVAQQIDGRRSIDDIAATLARSLNAPPERVAHAVRVAVARILAECARPS